jgi:hypothetical protein
MTRKRLLLAIILLTSIAVLGCGLTPLLQLSPTATPTRTETPPTPTITLTPTPSLIPGIDTYVKANGFDLKLNSTMLTDQFNTEKIPYEGAVFLVANFNFKDGSSPTNLWDIDQMSLSDNLAPKSSPVGAYAVFGKSGDPMLTYLFVVSKGEHKFVLNFPEEVQIPLSELLPTTSNETVILNYFDDFSDSSSGWTKTSSTTSSRKFSEGQYLITVKSANFRAWGTFPGNYSDVLINVDIALDKLSSESGAGIICRLQDNDNYYFANISLNAGKFYYRLGVQVDGKNKYFTDESWVKSDLIIGDINRVTFSCVKDEFMLGINGSELLRTQDDSIKSGKIGLMAIAFDEAPSTVAFDNLALQNFSPTVSSITTTKAITTQIKLGPGKYGKPIWLEVVQGSYKLTTGTTLKAGSMLDVTESVLTFPVGLAIDISGGDVAIKGKTYSDGDQLVVGSGGLLTPR